MEDELEFDWHKFFLEAGIPETHALSYADVFVDNRITEAMMDDLDKDVLAELGVAAIGDVLAIQKAARIAASSDGSNIGITKNQKEIWERERKRFENQLVSERTTFKSEKEKLNDRLKMRNEEIAKLKRQVQLLSKQLKEARSTKNQSAGVIDEEDDDVPTATINLADLDDTVRSKGKRKPSAVTAAQQAANQTKQAKRSQKPSVLSRLSGTTKKTKGRGSFKAKDGANNNTTRQVTKRNIQSRLSKS
eukprot:TRINITY_DN7504_c0_g1_i2.p1 TRINITY_DN7504_c0_g1~~TRINITY_DN7504_c0_g1_i2.p1  ORF type:complete len:248 (+),score=82.68 TRINITY_DN7504_c0_g1_i2:66-809(+)